MSLVTPDTIQTLQRKQCLTAKRVVHEHNVGSCGECRQPAACIMCALGVISPTEWLVTRARLQNEPGPRAGCGQSARPVR